MNFVTFQDIKKKGALALKDSGPTYLISHSKVKGAFVPLAEYEQMIEALEELQDIALADKRIKQPIISSEEFWGEMPRVSNSHKSLPKKGKKKSV